MIGFIGTIMLGSSIFATQPIRGPYLTWVHDPRTTITITWATESEENTLIEYGLDTIATDTIIEPGLVKEHSIEITNLVPDTSYYYRIGSDSYISEYNDFKTARTGQRKFKFVAFGDTRTNHDDHQLVANAIAQVKPDFYLHSGDFVFLGFSIGEWNTYFQIEREIQKHSPIVPAIGNHEWPFTNYLNLFHLPSPEEWYSLKYGNVYFIVLDTETDLTGSQLDFLQSELSIANTDTDIRWIIVMFHQPPYSAGGDHDSNQEVRDAWCGLFETFGVDLVFNGHNHFYQRTYPISDVIYITSAGGGAPLADPDPGPDWIAYTEKTLNFCYITVDGNTLHMDAIKPDGKTCGTIFDSLTLIKPTGIEENIFAGKTCSYSSVRIQSVPNPFIHTTELSYRIPEMASVSLRLYDSTGRLIDVLFEGDRTPGEYTIQWDAKDNLQGTYFAVLDVNGNRSVRKVCRLNKSTEKR